MQISPFATNRLNIRTTTEADGILCTNLWLDKQAGKYLGDPPREKADENYFNFAVGIEEEDDWYPMVVFQKQSGEFLGTCSIVPMDENSRWDLGYCISPLYWKQGYGTELLQKLIALGIEKGVASFSAEVAKENIASNALLKKLGFQIIKDDQIFQKKGTEIVYAKYTYSLKVTKKTNI